MRPSSLRCGRSLMLAALLAGCSQSPATGPSATASAPKDQQAPTVRDAALARVADRVAKDGEAGYLKQVTDTDADWQHLLDKTEEGDSQALALAGRLRGHADAANAEALDTAVARALPKAPGAVLASVAAGGKVDVLCTSPFIEPEAGVERRYNAAALNALDHLPKAQRPQPAFDACRAALVKMSGQLAR